MARIRPRRGARPPLRGRIIVSTMTARPWSTDFRPERWAGKDRRSRRHRIDHDRPNGSGSDGTAGAPSPKIAGWPERTISPKTRRGIVDQRLDCSTEIVASTLSTAAPELHPARLAIRWREYDASPARSDRRRRVSPARTRPISFVGSRDARADKFASATAGAGCRRSSRFISGKA